MCLYQILLAVAIVLYVKMMKTEMYKIDFIIN